MSFASVPVDVIGDVLSYSSATPSEVLRYSRVCSRWCYAATSSSTLWSQMFLVQHRWSFKEGVPDILIRANAAEALRAIEVACSPTRLTEVHLVGLKIRSIGSGLFKMSPNLATCTLRDLPVLETIGDYFLAGSHKLARVDFHGLRALTSIGHSFLEGCRALTAFNAGGFGALTSLGRSFLKDCTSLVSFSSSSGATRTGHDSGLHKLEIISDFFLFGCTSLSEFDGSGLCGVHLIGEGFLMKCTSLRSFKCAHFGDLREIGHHFLKRCTSLTSFDSAGLKQLRLIGNSFCKDCTSLTSVNIDSLHTVKEIDYGFFGGCSSLDLSAREALGKLQSAMCSDDPTFSHDAASIEWLKDVADATSREALEALQEDMRFRSDSDLLEDLRLSVSEYSVSPPVDTSSPLLSPSQAAALRVFIKKYGYFNKLLRNRDTASLASFLKLFLSGLGLVRDARLHGTAARDLYFGTQRENLDDFKSLIGQGSVFRTCVWWLTEDEGLARSFAGDTGVFFVFSGLRDVAPMSGYAENSENTWFMLPGVQLRSTEISVDGTLTVVKVEQVESSSVPFPSNMPDANPGEDKAPPELQQDGPPQQHFHPGFSEALEVVFPSSADSGTTDNLPVNADDGDWTLPIEGVGSASDVAVEVAIKLDDDLASSHCGEDLEASWCTGEGRLSRDQKLAIWLYTGEKLHHRLNARLRDPRTRQDGTIRPFLKLLLAGLALLRDSAKAKPQKLFRGVGDGADIDIEQFGPGKELIWWQFSSFSSSEEVAKRFITGEPRVFFTLLDGTDVSPVANVSQFAAEEEWILSPGVLLEVVASNSSSDGFVEIVIKQIGPSQVDFPPPPPPPPLAATTSRNNGTTPSRGSTTAAATHGRSWQGGIDSALL